MINQTTNSTNKAVYTPLSNGAASYTIVKPLTATQKQEIEREKEKKEHKYGVGIATAALTTGFGILLLATGLNKGVRLKLTHAFKFLEEKSLKLTAQKSNLTTLQNIYLGSINKLKKLTQYVHGYFNVSPLKDAPPKVFAEKNPFMKKIWDGISHAFERISVKTSRNSYANTGKKFKKLYEEFAKINSKINPDKAEAINAQIEHIKTLMSKGFGIEAQDTRLIQAKKNMGNIHEKFFERTLAHPIKMLKDKRSYTTFISEDLAAPAKMRLNTNLNQLKQRISISLNDNCTAIKKQLNNLDSVFGLTMGESRTSLLNTRKALETYRKTGDKQTKNILIKELKKLKTFSNDVNITEELTKSIELLNQNNKMGEIQKLMAEYKKILPAEEYAKLSKNVNKTLKSLDKSIDMEGDKLFDKIRDIQIGSAPMDLAGVLGSFGVVSWFLGKSEDKDERISAALKYGIPAIGAVAISLYCTVGLVSGGPALLIGLISGKAINYVGSFIDKKRKEYKNNEKKPSLADAAQILPDITNNIKKDISLIQNKSSL